MNLELKKEFTNVDQTLDTDNDGTPDRFIALPGDTVEFQIQVTNNDVASATDIVIKDDLTKVLPVGLTVQSLILDGGINLDTSGQGDGDAQTIEVQFANLAPGESKTITVNAKVSDQFIKAVSLSGTFGATDPNANDPNATLPEYHETAFNTTLFLNYNVQKETDSGEANFGFLNITSAAEIVSVDRTLLAPGSIAASARLDVSTYEIKARLNNGQEFRALSIENFSDSTNPVSFFLNPDPAGGGSSYPYLNHSAFLPPGQIGISNFLGEWAKITNDPIYAAKLAAWMNLTADGDLSDTQDEAAVINALADFVESGVYRRDTYTGGSFAFQNNTQTQELNFKAGEFALKPTQFVNVLVTDNKTVVTNSQGGSLGSFANLQKALDSFNFATPTGVNITLQDSSGDGAVTTRLQKLGGFNFERKWTIQKIAIASNVQRVTFDSGNGSANLDFSLQNLAIASQPLGITLRGGNAKDTITGTAFADKIEGLNGNDVLSGFGGNDTILGGNGKDTIIGGRGDDTLTGGLGNDMFVFGVGFGDDIITDFKRKDILDFSELNLSSGVLDSNGNGRIDANDNLADAIGGNLVIDLTSLNGGTLALTGVTSVNMTSVIL